MKNYILIFSMLMIMSVLYAQTKTKPVEKPPTQKDIQKAEEFADKAIRVYAFHPQEWQ